MKKKTVPKTRIAAIADLHVRASDQDKWKSYFVQISRKADVLLLCGDLTNTGSGEEAAVLAGELEACSIPVLGVLGNHDHEKGCPREVFDTLRESGVEMLSGDCTIVRGVGFAGVKGFGGGFDRYKLSAFGEKAIKVFVEETLGEIRLLEDALTRLEARDPSVPRVVLLHYAPIEATVRGELEQIYPFLGSSRLAEPLVNHQVQVAFHGHAHRGQLQGSVSGVKIFNVAHEILVKEGYELPFFLYEI